MHAHALECRAHLRYGGNCSAVHAPTVFTLESQSEQPSGLRTAPARCSCKILPKATSLVRDYPARDEQDNWGQVEGESQWNTGRGWGMASLSDLSDLD